MSNVRFQVKVSYWVAMEFEGLENKDDVIKALRGLKDDLISYKNENSDEESIVIDWFQSEFSESDAYKVEYEIEQLEVDNEEIF